MKKYDKVATRKRYAKNVYYKIAIKNKTNTNFDNFMENVFITLYQGYSSLSHNRPIFQIEQHTESTQLT